MGCAERLLLHQRAHRLVFGEAGHGSYVDVEVIELAAARGRIRAHMQRLGGEQRMQRVYAENRGSARTSSTGEDCKIGEVPDTPILPAPQAVELTAEAPAMLPRPELGRQIAAIGGDD